MSTGSARALFVAVLSGCSGGGGSSAEILTEVRFVEASGPDDNVIRIALADVQGAVLDPNQRTFEFELRASGLRDKELFGLSFDLEIQSDIGLSFVSFTPSDAEFVVVAGTKNDDPNKIVFGVAAGKGSARRLPADFVLGTVALRAASLGEANLQITKTGQPGLGGLAPGFAFIAEADILKQVKGPAVRGGTLLLR